MFALSEVLADWIVLVKVKELYLPMIKIVFQRAYAVSLDEEFDHLMLESESEQSLKTLNNCYTCFSGSVFIICFNSCINLSVACLVLPVGSISLGLGNNS